MHGMSDDILDQVRSREVTGVFHSRKALIAAAENLLVAGIDHADIDVSAPLDELQRRLNYQSIPAPDLADLPVRPPAAFNRRRRYAPRGGRRRERRRWHRRGSHG